MSLLELFRQKDETDFQKIKGDVEEIASADHNRQFSIHANRFPELDPKLGYA